MGPALDSVTPGRALRAAGYGVGLGAIAGLGTLAYAAGYEVRNFVVRRVELPVLPRGHRPLKVLHVSDLHLTPYQARKRRWLASLADLEPDLVINTGDNLAHEDSVEPVVEGFGRLLDVPGVFVFGSNDYFSPTLRNPSRTSCLMTAAQHERPEAAVARAPRCLREAWVDRPHEHAGGSTSEAPPWRSPGWTTPTWATTTWSRSLGRRRRTSTSGSVWRMRRTSGCSTSTPATARTSPSPDTHTADRSACPSRARS